MVKTAVRSYITEGKKKKKDRRSHMEMHTHISNRTQKQSRQKASHLYWTKIWIYLSVQKKIEKTGCSQCDFSFSETIQHHSQFAFKEILGIFTILTIMKVQRNSQTRQATWISLLRQSQLSVVAGHSNVADSPAPFTTCCFLCPIPWN